MTLTLLFVALLSAMAPDDQPRPLFNGKDLDGWAHVGKGRVYVDEGLLKTEGGMGLLWYTREKIGNATLRVVYKVSDKAANSGVFIRIPVEPKSEDDAIHKGIEVQIFYANLLFAACFGERSYNSIARMQYGMLLGERLFCRAAYINGAKLHVDGGYAINVRN